MTFNLDQTGVEPASICLALIHNNNEPRNAMIRPALSKLSDFLGASRLGVTRQVTCIEVSWQPPLTPASTALAFTQDAICKIIERHWLEYRRLKRRSAIVSARKVMTLAVNYLTDKGGVRARRRRCGAIEAAVTEKHIRAWSRFLDSDSDILICFEDDAVFKADSCDRMLTVLEAVNHAGAKELFYADLAGGLPRSVLRAGSLEEGRKGSLVYYKKPITNTACTYLLNRETAKGFLSILSRSPWLRLVGIDLLMNQLFVELEKQGRSSACFHADPTVFNHGSTTGEFQAWQR